jgi:nucleotide-binding universal stress UspA family protein
MITLKKILVATDFSEPSEAALAYSRELARNFGAALTIMNVVENLLTRAYGVDGGVVMIDPELQRQIEDGARQELDKLISKEDRDLLKAEGVVLVSGMPADAIISRARQTNTDLIVMGTHGRGGMAHLFLGSVSERVVRTAPCPVLTVRHPQHEFVLPDALVAVSKA